MGTYAKTAATSGTFLTRTCPGRNPGSQQKLSTIWRLVCIESEWEPSETSNAAICLIQHTYAVFNLSAKTLQNDISKTTAIKIVEC